MREGCDRGERSPRTIYRPPLLPRPQRPSPIRTPMEAYAGTKVQTFKFNLDKLEGGESAHVRVTTLLDFITSHENRIATLERDMPHNFGASARLKKATRGGGSMQRMLKLKDDAVVVEITHRKRTNELIPVDYDNTERSDVDNMPPFSDNMPRQLLLAAYKDVVKRIEREMDMEEASVKKPSVTRTCEHIGEW